MRNTNSSGSIVTKRKNKRLDGEMKRQLLYMATGVALGFLLPYAKVYGGLAPFGVGLVSAVTGPGTVLVYLATLAGYLVQGLSDSLRYMAALITVAGIRWAVSGFRRICESRIFAAVVAFLGTVITGSALLLSSSPSAMSVLTIVSEGLLAGGFAFFVATINYEVIRDEYETLSHEAEVSTLVLLSVGMMALLTVEFSGISPARILSLFAVLLAARTGKWSGGCTVGAFFGTAILLTTPQYLYLTPAFALGGLLAGVFSEKGKWASALMLLAAVGIVTVPTRDEALVILSLYEAAAAGILFMVSPPIVESVWERTFYVRRATPELRAAGQATALKMNCAARAMEEVAGTVDEVSAQLSGLGAPDMGSVYQAVSEDVCRSCRLRLTCWKTYFTDTMDSFNHLTPLLQRDGSIDETSFTGRVKDSCGRLRELSVRINAGYREFLVRESAFRRLNELRQVVTDQFAATAQMLEEFADTLSKPEQMDVVTARRIHDAMEGQGIRIRQVICRINELGRMAVEILLDGKYQTQNREAFCRRIGEICGRNFSLPVIDYAGQVTRIAFTERHTYRVVVGSAQLRCEGEQLCGDAYECFQDGNGRQYAVLSDGMGSGGRAAVDGAMASGLASRLLKAGFGNESILRLVNAALMAKSEDESLATLDIAFINLFSGEMELLKAGAGVSLLYSKGRVCRLDDSSLPLGILRELTFAVTRDRLVDGDILVLMSDGVSNDGIDWVEDLLRDYDRDAGGMQGLAQLIAGTARDRQSDEKGDDVTVIAMGVHRLR